MQLTMTTEGYTIISFCQEEDLQTTPSRMFVCMCTCALFCLGIYLSSLVAAPQAAKEEDAQDAEGKKKNKKGSKEKAKKGGDKSDPKMSAAVIPDQEKDGGIVAKPGRTKKPTKKTERIVEVTGDDDVEGGGT